MGFRKITRSSLCNSRQIVGGMSSAQLLPPSQPASHHFAFMGHRSVDLERGRRVRRRLFCLRSSTFSAFSGGSAGDDGAGAELVGIHAAWRRHAGGDAGIASIRYWPHLESLIHLRLAFRSALSYLN
ncbi:unnamed protein product [Cylicocyclus nassatus]|uniref:Uncharacterized protein n=1 Tax=Cylicocyclus nassatus TaxID=53992 RepID=A0AA36ME09_CYLNA|nr:unnamed protein product [Cylicocyclus nassatus]